MGFWRALLLCVALWQCASGSHLRTMKRRLAGHLEACGVFPFDLRPDNYFNDPWDRNLGCRLDITTACYPVGSSEAEADAACLEWVERNCGAAIDGTVFEAYGDGTKSLCRVNLRHPDGASSINYQPFTGYTSNSNNVDRRLAELPTGELFEGCRVNFVLNPPAHDGVNPGDAGCEWFVAEYCPGKELSDFEVAVSTKADANGNLVCALGPKFDITDPTNVCDVTPVDQAPDDFFPGPDFWDRNLGCRVDIDSSCVPEGLSGEEADQACVAWKNKNCGTPKGDTYWEVYASPTGPGCKINLRHPSHEQEAVEYYPYTGTQRAEMHTFILDYGGTYNGCTVNFVLHPPASDNDDTDPAGCEWFVDEYCDGLSLGDFTVVVSAKKDINGNHVCAMQRTSLAT